MFLLRYSTAVICAVFIFSGAVSGVDVKKAVGDQVSFHLDKTLPPSVTSIIWKHINSDGITVKAIEWDDEGINIPNQRFKGITTLDEKTGQITITKLNFSHTGVYTIDINSKEQEQRFNLIIKERVSKPKIKIERIKNDPNAVYLRCKILNSDTIIWKNSTGHILKGSEVTSTEESITVRKNGDPDNFYTCTLDNGASQETSDPVYERDLFKDESNGGPWWIVIIVILIIGIIGVGVFVLYKRDENFRRFVAAHCPCFKEPQNKSTDLTRNNGNDERENEPKPETVRLNADTDKGDYDN